MSERKRPKLAVWKFSGCDGCQLTLLDCEDELLALAGEVRICHFLEATRRVEKGPYDLSLVEGSITTPDDVRAIRDVRRQSRFLVAIGACATAGGIQALRNFASVRDYVRYVYPHPDHIDTLTTSTAISDHVPVDFELRGCPIDKGQLLEVLGAYLNGRKPNIARHSVCVDCKAAGTVCRMVALGEPCLGPVTMAGCGALCPRHGRGCFGCFGPAETANTAPLAARLAAEDGDGGRLRRRFLGICANADPFRREGERHG